MNYEEINFKHATLIDVREPFELENDGKIEGSINIPLGNVPTEIDFFKSVKKPAVLYCRSGYRSGQAIVFLQANGVNTIFNGGSWQEVLNKLDNIK